MPKACNLKKNDIVEIDRQFFAVKKVETKTPSARGAATLYKIRFSNVRTRQKLDKNYKGDDFIEDADLNRRPAQFLFQDGDQYTFMDTENYEQYTLTAADLEDQVLWLTDGLQGITALLINDQILGIELPASVDFEIIDTAPALKGASARSSSKPATLSTGLEIQVPEYLATGETIKVNTDTGKFMSRV